MRSRLCGHILHQGIHQVAWCYQGVSDPQHMVSITDMGSMVQESCPVLTGGLVTYNVTVTYSLSPSHLHVASIPRKISSELQGCSLQSYPRDQATYWKQVPGRSSPTQVCMAVFRLL